VGNSRPAPPVTTLAEGTDKFRRLPRGPLGLSTGRVKRPNVALVASHAPNVAFGALNQHCGAKRLR